MLALATGWGFFVPGYRGRQIGVLGKWPIHARGEMREIDENLIRAELTASQRAYAIKRRRELWVMRHGESEESGNTPPTLSEPTTGRGHKQFAADTADRTGQSKRSINEHISRADALGDDLDAGANR